jgi:hypothetical protein
VVGGAGVATGVAALAHLLWNKGRYDRWQAEDERLAADPGAPNFTRRQVANDDLADSVRRASVVTVSLAVGGAALAALGTVLIVTSPKKHDAALALGIGVGPGMLTWRMMW